tara:strand:+ start:398 stop:637 length:240 start_codon:yes stop_codon:yes gene_type:complete
MIAINTDECIDSAVCEPECPVDAIKPDTIPDATKWIAFNQKYAGIWLNISEKSEPMVNADDWADVPDKMVHLSKNPAQQ